MRAALLAAGLGTRLRPLTDATPKCLISVGGSTLLDRWLDALAFAGVDEVVVNTHHLPEQVEAHIARRRGTPPAVRIAYEPELLGSAGTLSAHADFFAGDDMFLAVNADNLTSFDVGRLVDAHRGSAALATLTLFNTPRPTECGIVEVKNGLVVGFEEKPEHPRSTLANAGMYAFDPDVLALLVHDPLPLDIGHHLLPRLVGKARAVSIGNAYFADIGTPEALASAQLEWHEEPRR